MGPQVLKPMSSCYISSQLFHGFLCNLLPDCLCHTCGSAFLCCKVLLPRPAQMSQGSHDAMRLLLLLLFLFFLDLLVFLLRVWMFCLHVRLCIQCVPSV